MVNDWEVDYWTEQVKKSRSNFDSQQLRPYIPYKLVKSGILSLASQLFGVTFRQNTRAKVWHPSVECWEMFEGTKILGRFYLDMHPRPDKFTHGAYYSIRTGIAGVQLPELALVCNLPGGDKDDPGLLKHEDLQTFLHEFGHLLHEILAGSRPWVGTSGVSTEYDFIEAPSQMLEEWIWDPATLRRFARHYQSGEVIPDSLLKQLKAAKEFGKGMYVRRQVFFAKMALLLHSQSPSGINSDQLVKDLSAKYKYSPFVEGTHFQCSFTHLRNYSALVYTYLWSHVIAKDMFSRFNPADLLDPQVAKRYREAVLSPGGSAPAEVLIRNFLGRPFNTNAWQSWLNTD